MIEIAQQFMSSKTTVRKLLLQYQIPIRQCGKRKKTAQKERYGNRLINGKVADHKQEQKVINSIMRMYEQEGLSYNAIARILNEMKVKTKKQGKKWHMETVRQIVLRENTPN